MKAKVIPVELEDFPVIDDIEKTLFAYPFPLQMYINDFTSNSFSHYFKLVLKEKIIGYLALWITFEDCQIISVGVDKPYQGHGYGAQLIEHAIKFAKEHLCTNITLEVRVSNEKAIKLYTKMGFYKIYLRENYYEDGEDAFLMRFDIKY